MKQKTFFTLTLLFLALGTSGSNPIAPKNYYQFGLGVWVIEPFHSQVYAMSYERAINGKFAIGGVFTYQIEEYRRSSDAPIEVPLHDFVYGEAFSHPHLLSDNITAPGFIYYTGTIMREEEIFCGIYASYTLFRKQKSFADIALGGGLMTWSLQAISKTGFRGIKIDNDTIYGWSRIPYYRRELGLAGFFRARYSYQFYENLYLGSSLVLPYVYASGFPLKFTFNVGMKF